MTILNQATNQPDKNRAKLWLAAIKPPMYTVAIIPISFGTALAYWATGVFDGKIFFTFLGSAIAIIAWLNLTNDVFDADTGIDVNKAHSVVNLTGNKNLVFWIANLFLLLGLGGIFLINWWQKDSTVFWLILASCFLGYTYQGPPFRFGYLGLGEIICFFTFGPMAIASAYYSQTQAFSSNSLLVSAIIGISTSIILFCSHFHQIEDDLAAGKKSPIVRFGTNNGAKIVIISTLMVYALSTIFVISQRLPQETLLIWLSFPIAYQLITHVNQYHGQPEKISNSKFMAVNFHFLSGLLLCLGLWLHLHI